MLTITVEFVHGVFRADPDGSAPTGFQDRGEWPPSPSRLFAALVAADGTGDRQRVTTGVELSFLEHLPPPIIVADADRDVVHTKLEARYVVEADVHVAPDGAMQEYVARKGTEVRPGVRVVPRHPRVSFVWPDCRPAAELERALRLRAARVGYLGCADSPVVVTVESDATDPSGPRYVPDPDGDLAVGVPAPGLLEALDAHFERWLVGGPSVRRSQSPGLRRLARYRSPGQRADRPPVRATALWFVLDRRVSGRRLISVTDTLRKATLELLDRHVGEVPAVIHGHTDDSSGYDTVRFVALPDVGHRHAKGHIHGVGIVFPAGDWQQVAADCRAAMAHLTELVGPGFAVGVRPWSGETVPRAADPARWHGPATRWATVFPAVHERRRKQLSLADVADWCEHAGLPQPTAFRESRGPFIPGGIDLAPSEVVRPGRPARPYSHFEIDFASPVTGPVIIGAGRQFGLGLCAPIG